MYLAPFFDTTTFRIYVTACRAPNLEKSVIFRDVARILSLGGLKPMASAEREPITGVWGQSPQRGPGAEPLVGVRGGEALLKLKGF